MTGRVQACIRPSICGLAHAAGPDEVRGSAPRQVNALLGAANHRAGLADPGSTVCHHTISTSPSLSLFDFPARRLSTF